MKLSSSAFGSEEKIPSKYTCDGNNINPPLEIVDVPEGAQSLVLIMEDPDVPKNLREDGLWIHWVVFDMPADLREINEGREPSGIGGAGTNGKQGYFGPCPPDREHRYFFKLFALDKKLALAGKATRDDVLRAMEGHILEQTELLGLYERV